MRACGSSKRNGPFAIQSPQSHCMELQPARKQGQETNASAARYLCLSQHYCEATILMSCTAMRERRLPSRA